LWWWTSCDPYGWLLTEVPTIYRRRSVTAVTVTAFSTGLVMDQKS